VSLGGCGIDFTEAVPCDDDSHCPTDFTCDTAVSQCVPGQADVEGNNGGNNAPVNNDANNAGTNNEPVNNDTNNGEPVNNGTNNGTNNGEPVNNGTNNGTNNGEPVNNGVNNDTNNGEPVNNGGNNGTNNGEPVNNGGNNGEPVNNGGNNGVVECPAEMAPIGGSCIDRYEASRQDADAGSAGGDNSVATSRAGVLPWTLVTRDEASNACVAAGKRLCTVEEWQMGCAGPDNRVYPYSEAAYNSETCNSSDALQPTGSFPGCVHPDLMVFDMSGNAAEVVDTGAPGLPAAGGSYTDTSPTRFACPASPESASPRPDIGFSCCLTP
jgi:hypothetical protein